MRDVASESDERGITLQRVGVRDIHLPVMIREKSGRRGRMLGRFDAGVEVPAGERGTHMSRFVEILARWSKKAISMLEMEQILDEMAQSFGARSARLSLSFKYFLDKRAPASGIVSPLDYECAFEAQRVEGRFDFVLQVQVPIITLCPCSKEISDRGAHSQRALLTARLRTAPGVVAWLEDLIPLLEAQGSYGIYPLLKRADEKVVTEGSYDNPKFVEDVVRDALLALRTLPGATWYSAECESIESIHNHLAYAYAESG